MPQLLLELVSEEIPARMQKRAEEDLAKALREKLEAAGLEPKAMRTFSGPRRLGLAIDHLAAATPDVNEEKKGPRVGAPDRAIQGFLKSAGLRDISEAEVVEDKKGAFYVARIERKGQLTAALLQEIVPEIIRAFPWPKSMRSGTSDLQWVRPLQNIMCIFGGAHVAISVDGVPSEAKTWGHRFHAPAAFQPKDFADYAAKLRAAKVEIDREARKAKIIEDTRKACAAKKLELVEDQGLLEEVAGLVEWPVVLLGDMDPAFLDLPGEVIRLSMRTHQKYFAVRDADGKLAPHFVVVANIEAKDGGQAIAAGNARVLSARLNDARFFWETDKKTPLYTEARKAKLQKIVFHQKLGSVWDKVERVKALAGELAPLVWESLGARLSGASRSDEPGTQGQAAPPSNPWVPDRASRVRNDELLASFIAAIERAADLCKMDLVTETVGEFPELQGQVGRALAEFGSEPLPLEGGGAGVGVKEPVGVKSSSRTTPPHPLTPSPSRGGGAPAGHPSVCAAIEDHYRPLGPNDRVPTDPVAVTLALADKLDTLVGFWAIDEKPTGSSDPYALRRAALGLVRIILHNNIRIGLFENVTGGHWPGVVSRAARSIADVRAKGVIDPVRSTLPEFVKHAGHRDVQSALSEKIDGDSIRDSVLRNIEDFPAFLADRLKVQLRVQGKRHDLVDAVFAPNPITKEVDDDLVRIVARVEALDAFLKSQDGANLLAGYKRAANTLAAEEKKVRWSAEDAQGEVNSKLLAEPAEKALNAALEAALPAARAGVEHEDFAAAMKALSTLRAPVYAMLDDVTVNAEDAALRRNRLLLLTRFRDALSAVADFSKIEG